MVPFLGFPSHKFEPGLILNKQASGLDCYKKSELIWMFVVKRKGLIRMFTRTIAKEPFVRSRDCVLQHMQQQQQQQIRENQLQQQVKVSIYFYPVWNDHFVF